MKTYLLIFSCVLSFFVVGQNKGNLTIKVIDVNSVNREVVVGAKVILTSETDPNAIFKAITSSDGTCIISNLIFGDYQANASMIGFEPMAQPIKITKTENTLTILLGGNQEFEEVKVIGNLVNEGNVPVAVTKISLQKITEELGSRDLPNVDIVGLIHFDSWANLDDKSRTIVVASMLSCIEWNERLTIKGCDLVDSKSMVINFGVDYEINPDTPDILNTHYNWRTS